MAAQTTSYTEKKQWWKELIIYQVYPRSFSDSNGDGIGDINGVTSRLDYLKDLGIDCIWLCPVYESPNEDNGYDVSDYKGIMKEFGTMEDWERFVAEAHKREIKLVMDLVLNHTSKEHQWFVESRKSHDNPFRNYYIWRPERQNRGINESKEPNNWLSMFGGSAWEHDETTNEYYLHLFAKGQPDLNWENKKVRQELHDMVEWWCQKGVDGFRLDAINVVSKTPGLPDGTVKNPKLMYHWAGEHFFNGPKFIEWLREMKQKVFSKYHVFTVGETPAVTLEQAREFTHDAKGAFNMLFQFELMDVGMAPGSTKWKCRPWQLHEIKDATSRWQTGLDGVGWNSTYMENHDQPRSLSRFGNDSTEELRTLSGKMLAAWLLTLKGTPFIYQGQELGMTNVQFPSIEDYRDVEIFNFFNHQISKGRHVEEVMKAIWTRGRDNTRTPIPWSDAPNAGFCPPDVQPWIKLNPNYPQVNVERERKNEFSVLNFYKKIIRIRKNHPIFVYGQYELLLPAHEQVYAYVRNWEGDQMLIFLNWTKETVSFDLSQDDKSKIIKSDSVEILINNYEGEDGTTLIEMGKLLQDPITLRPYQSRVYLLKGRKEE